MVASKIVDRQIQEALDKAILRNGGVPKSALSARVNQALDDAIGRQGGINCSAVSIQAQKALEDATKRNGLALQATAEEFVPVPTMKATAEEFVPPVFGDQSEEFAACQEQPWPEQIEIETPSEEWSQQQSMPTAETWDGWQEQAMDFQAPDASVAAASDPWQQQERGQMLSSPRLGQYTQYAEWQQADQHGPAPPADYLSPAESWQHSSKFPTQVPAPVAHISNWESAGPAHSPSIDCPTLPYQCANVMDCPSHSPRIHCPTLPYQPAPLDHQAPPLQPPPPRAPDLCVEPPAYTPRVPSAPPMYPPQLETIEWKGPQCPTAPPHSPQAAAPPQALRTLSIPQDNRTPLQKVSANTWVYEAPPPLDAVQQDTPALLQRLYEAPPPLPQAPPPPLPSGPLPPAPQGPPSKPPAFACPPPSHPPALNASAFDGFLVATGHKELGGTQTHDHHEAWSEQLAQTNLFHRSERMEEKETNAETKCSQLHILTSEQDSHCNSPKDQQTTQGDLHAWQCNTSSSGSTIIGNFSSSSSELQSEVSSESGDHSTFFQAEDHLCEPDSSLLGSKLLVWRRSFGAQLPSEPEVLTAPVFPFGEQPR